MPGENHHLRRCRRIFISPKKTEAKTNVIMLQAKKEKKTRTEMNVLKIEKLNNHAQNRNMTIPICSTGNKAATKTRTATLQQQQQQQQ